MIVLDTHVLVWAVDGDERLGRVARSVIDEADRICVSAITPWEIVLLAERGRLRLGLDVGAWLGATLELPRIHLMPIEPTIALDSLHLPGEFDADPADRLIVATARHCCVPLLTADPAMLEYAARGHVHAVDASR